MTAGMRCEIKVIGEPRKRLIGDGAQLVLMAVLMVGLLVLFLMGFVNYQRRVADEQASRVMKSLDARVRERDVLIAEKLKGFRSLVPLAYPDGVSSMEVDGPVADLGWSELERKKAGLAVQWEIWQSLEGKGLKAYWEAHGQGLEMPETIWFQMARVLQAVGEFGEIEDEPGGSRVGLSPREMLEIVDEMRELVRLRMEAVEMRMERLRMEREVEEGRTGGGLNESGSGDTKMVG